MNMKDDLYQKFIERLSKFSVPNFSLLGILMNEQLLKKMEITYDSVGERFTLSYDADSGILTNESGVFTCVFKEDTFEIKHKQAMSQGLENGITYTGKLLGDNTLTIDTDRIFKDTLDTGMQREKYRYVISSDRKSVESISRKQGGFYSNFSDPSPLKINSSINYFSSGAVVYDHLEHTEGVVVSNNLNGISILTEPYSVMLDTINTMALPIEYKAGRIDDIRTEEQFADFMIRAMTNNQIDSNGSIINQNNNQINKKMGFTGIQLVGLIASISSITMAVIGILFLLITK